MYMPKVVSKWMTYEADLYFFLNHMLQKRREDYILWMSGELWPFICKE